MGSHGLCRCFACIFSPQRRCYLDATKQQPNMFDLYALDTKLNLPPRASKKQDLKVMKGHVLTSGELVGSFQH